jgi:hypothetical protein
MLPCSSRFQSVPDEAGRFPWNAHPGGSFRQVSDWHQSGLKEPTVDDRDQQPDRRKGSGERRDDSTTGAGHVDAGKIGGVAPVRPDWGKQDFADPRAPRAGAGREPACEPPPSRVRHDEPPGEDPAPVEVGADAQEYLTEKQEEGRRMAEPADAERDPAWQSKDHLDFERSSQKPSRSGAAKDAEGQAERGHIDQIITDKGYTQTR